MSEFSLDIDVGEILQIALFESREDSLYLLGRLPPWWVDRIGVVESDLRLAVRSAFLREYLGDANEFWKSQAESTQSSPLFEFEGASGGLPVLVQAIAVRKGTQRVLLLRNLNTSDPWLQPTLQAARSNLVQHERDRAAHLKEVAHITADRDEAYRREQLKSRVLANLSHEIRTPLATILGMVNASQSATADKRDEYLAAIASSANQMLALGNDILDLSKMQVDRLQLDSQPFDLLDFMRTLELQWKMLAAERNLEFRTEIVPDLPRQVSGDQVRLRQVLSNLVGNAMKFTEHGSVKVDLGWATAGTNTLRFSVVDTGVGIPPEDVPFIFEAFTQVDASKKRLHEGAGLGLAIAGRLVRLMGGEIHVESEPGKGSTFWFDAELQAVYGGKPEERKHDDQREPTCDGMRILIAEDHALNRSLIADMLTSAGAVVTEVENGEQAVAACNKSVFEVILMDCQMPVLDGLEATAAIRRMDHENSKTPIIALTAHAFRQEQEEIARSGADRCLTKPIEARKLIRDVVELAN